VTASVLAALVAAVGALAGSVLTVIFGRRQATADAELKRANAEQMRVTTAVSAAQAIRDLSEFNSRLIRDHDATRHQLAQVLDANDQHADWDRLVVESVRRLRDAVTGAGIPVDVGDLPDPPPLAVRTIPEATP
jgi:uncharacterized protein HemX